MDTFFLLSISFFHLIVPVPFCLTSVWFVSSSCSPVRRSYDSSVSARFVTLLFVSVIWLNIRTTHPILTSILITFPRYHLRLIHYICASSCLRWPYYRVHTWDLWESYSCLFHLHQWSQFLMYWLCTQFKRLYSFLVPLLLMRLTARVLSPNFQNSYFRFYDIRFESVMSLINEVLRHLHTSSRMHSSSTSAPTTLTLTLTATCPSVTWIWVLFHVFPVFFSLIIFRISFTVLFDASFSSWIRLIRVSSYRERLIQSLSYASRIKTLFILMILIVYLTWKPLWKWAVYNKINLRIIDERSYPVSDLFIDCEFVSVLLDVLKDEYSVHFSMKTWFVTWVKDFTTYLSSNESQEWNRIDHRDYRSICESGPFDKFVSFIHVNRWWENIENHFSILFKIRFSFGNLSFVDEVWSQLHQIFHFELRLELIIPPLYLTTTVLHFEWYRSFWLKGNMIIKTRNLCHLALFDILWFNHTFFLLRSRICFEAHCILSSSCEIYFS